MIGIIVKLPIKDGQQAAFEEFFKELATQVRANEPGTLVYDLVRKNGTTTEYYVIEEYRDEAAKTAHSESAYFKAAYPKFPAFVDGRAEFTRFEGRV